MPVDNRARAIKRRYSDGYLVAKTTVGFGGFIKAAGILLAIILLLGSFNLKAQLGPGIMYAGVALALVVGVLLFVFGVLVSAQGQVLMASLDSAVNSSPLLTEQEKESLILTTNSNNQRAVEHSTPDQEGSVGQCDLPGHNRVFMDQKQGKAYCPDCGRFL